MSLYGDHLALDPSFHDVEVGAEGAPSATRYARVDKAITDADIRCGGQVSVRSEPGEFRTCNNLLAKLAGRPWVIECSRCKTVNKSPQSTTPG